MQIGLKMFRVRGKISTVQRFGEQMIDSLGCLAVI